MNTGTARGVLIGMLMALGGADIATARPAAETITIPFNPHRDAVVVAATVHGVPMRFIIDTAVDPSIIDLTRAEAIGLPIDRSGKEEADGVGAARSPIYLSVIDGLVLGGVRFAKFDAAAMDMGPLSSRHGSPLDGVLGYSFLRDRLVLIDYPSDRFALLDGLHQARPHISSCRLSFTVPFDPKGEHTIPRIPEFRFGRSQGPASVDTGSSHGIDLLPAAFSLADVKSSYRATGVEDVTGARGAISLEKGRLGVPVGFGPFTLPSGQPVLVRQVAGNEEGGRVANIGNQVFRQMGLKILLDYPGKRMTFYGACKRPADPRPRAGRRP